MDFFNKVFSKEFAFTVKEKTEKAHHFMATNVFFKHVLLAFLIVFVSLWLSMFVLDIYTHHDEAIHVPDFKGKTVREAERLAEKHDLQVQVVDSIFSSEGVKGSVLEQNPPAFFTVKRNRTIFLTIKTLGEKMVKVPGVTHLSRTEAQIEIERSGLTVGHINYVSSQYADLVLYQKFKGKDVAEGSILPVNSEIDLVVGKGGATGDAEVPNVIGLGYDEAASELRSSSFTIGTVVFDRSVQTSADSSRAQIWKQYPEANDPSVQAGSKVDLWLTNDKSKVKEY